MGREMFRFVVGEPGGMRSSVWHAFQSGDDVYVMTRNLDQVHKVSLHRAGDCYAGFTSTYAKQARTEGLLRPGRSRQMLAWVGRGLNDDLTLALRIVVPGSQLAPLGDPQPGPPKPIVWIPAPPKGFTTEIDFLRRTPGILSRRWPGADSMHTQLVGRFILRSGAFCYAVWSHTEETSAWAEQQVREANRLWREDRDRWVTSRPPAPSNTLRMILHSFDKKYRVGALLEARVDGVKPVAA